MDHMQIIKYETIKNLEEKNRRKIGDQGLGKDS